MVCAPETVKSVLTRLPDVVSDTYNKEDDFKFERGRRYNSQFFSMYLYRSTRLKRRVIDNAMRKWGDRKKRIDGKTIIRKDKILDINSGELCWVTGTIYSDLKNKLNILQDVEKGEDDVIPTPPSSYIGENKDTVLLMLEDESGRAILDADEILKNNLIVTGCIVAILGVEVEAGVFDAVDIIFPEASPQRPLKAPGKTGNKIALVSGLRITNEANYDLRLELLKDYLSGELGSDDTRAYVSQITRLIIAGDSIAPMETKAMNDFFSTNNYGSKNTSKYEKESLEKLDRYITDLLCTIRVSIMPGENDLAEICVPQQPFHKSVFPSSKKYAGGKSLSTLTNPTWIELENRGLRLLGTSGQNINDIFKYMEPEVLADPDVTLSVMHATLIWQNIAPTAPDTLYCYPFENRDPFTLTDETPHVYFVGNQSSFASKTVSLDVPAHPNSKADVRLISVPSFSKTGQIVVLDLDTLECEPVTFNI